MARGDQNIQAAETSHLLLDYYQEIQKLLRNIEPLGIDLLLLSYLQLLHHEGVLNAVLSVLPRVIEPFIGKLLSG